MIVIVEGVDGSGKTTLCKQLLSAGYDQAVINGGVFEYSKYKSLKSNYKSDVVIMDRSFITDMVYRSLDCKTRRGMSLYEIVSICKDDIKIVHCKSDTSFEDSMLRGENNITTKEQNSKIDCTYDIITSMFKIFTNVEVMVYNWKTQNVDDVIKFIQGGGK